MSSEISKNEMKTLLDLMKRIEKFEILNNTQNWAVERLTWGLLLIVGGILDFVILRFTHEIIGFLNTIAWILIIVVGLFMSNFLKRNMLVTVKRRKSSFFVRTQIYWMLISVGMIFAFGYTELDHLTIPLIAVMMGVVFFVDNYLAKRKVQNFTGFILHYALPVCFILTAIINLVGFFVVGEVFEFYYGIIFGSIIGVIQMYGAFLLQRIIIRNRISTIENLTE